MSRVLLFLTMLGLSLAIPFELHHLSDAEIFHINSVQSSWKAGRNFEPKELERVKELLGVDIEGEMRLIARLPRSDAVIRTDLPENFDPREKWPQCKSLNEIRDQASCGSCWAFGPSEAMTDRICIHNNNTVHISAEDINDCCEDCGHGCHGGFPIRAWEYFQKSGVVSGGNYNSSEGCMPYSIPDCDHHTTGRYKPCGKVVATPRCERKCRAGYSKTYTQDKNFGQSVKTFVDAKSIMQELVDNGPVSTAFLVFSDFLSYKSGVYRHTTGSMLGGHAVKIIGYGVEKGEKYWLVANSWNTDWGDKGFFKILRGKNECGIEINAIAALPKK